MEIVTVIYALTCITTCLMSVCLLSGLIYYEVNINDRYKTLLNQIYSLLLGYIIIFIVAMNVLSVSHAIYGPLAEIWCHFISGVILGMVIAICMGLNESIFIKYLYCCAYKSIGCLNDYFSFYFLARLNVLLAIYLSIFLELADMGPMPLFLFCTGCNTVDHSQTKIYKREIPYPIYIIWLTLIFHVILKYKINKTKTTLQSLTASTNGITSSPRHAILSTWMNLFILLLFGVTASTLIMNLGKDGDNFLVVHLARPISNILLGCVVPGYSFYKHPNIREFILKSLM